ncbi:MAG: 4-alpha-glucanotransferase [Limisphaerales bacterium]
MKKKKSKKGGPRRAETPGDDLIRLARFHGVRTGYQDMAGASVEASPEALRGVLRALGVPVNGRREVAEALLAAERTTAGQALEPVHVAWRGRRTTIPLTLRDGGPTGVLRLRWELDDGGTRDIETRWERLATLRTRRLDGSWFVTRGLPAFTGLPPGYHRLVAEAGGGCWATEVFCAPERCFAGQGRRRRWGVFAPLYAIHSERSWGGGDLGDLDDFIRWVGDEGGGMVGTLPLLPAFLDRPCEPSPYSPVSRLFWNEFYLDIERIPELATCPAARRLLADESFTAKLTRLRRDTLVDYPAQMALKRRVLEALCRSFFSKPSPRRRKFEAHLRANPRLADYARFRAVHEQRGGAWTDWPERMRGGELRDADCRASLRNYHQFVQWLVQEQMSEVAERARGRDVDLYLDLPLGTHRSGYDAWRHQDVFALDASGGCPPDPVFTQGQDWGFAPIHPWRSRERGHAYVRDYLRHHLRFARMLRIDHVMGLHRLYWVPRGLPATHGAYVGYPAEEFHAMLSIESHRHRAVIVGENLGTVPREVDQSLRRHGVNGMYVVQYEVRPRPRRPLRDAPSDVVASLNTHDMPPFAAFLRGLDLPDRADLGLIRRGDLAREFRDRKRLVDALRNLVARGRGSPRGFVSDESVLRGIVGFLRSGEARWLLLNLEDLWLETASQNTPSTSTERINWRRKTRLSLEQLRRDGPWLGDWVRRGGKG